MRQLGELVTCRPNTITSSMDSASEAFSYNPADGSFAALPDRTAANTRYLRPVLSVIEETNRQEHLGLQLSVITGLCGLSESWAAMETKTHTT